MLSQFYQKLFPSSSSSSNIRIFDGGMGTELERLGVKINDSDLWSTKVLLETPALIKKVHKSFLVNGANIIGTTTYQLSPETLKNYFASSSSEKPEDVNSVCQKAITVAKEAIEEVKKEKAETENNTFFIFGCVGSIGSSLPNGNEFSGKYPQECLTEEYMMKFHLDRIVALVSNPNVDALLIETQPRLDEVIFLLTKVIPQAFYDAQRSIPVFVSFCCFMDPKTKTIVNGSGEDLEKCYSTLFNLNQSKKMLAGLGCNCSSPEVVEGAFEIFSKLLSVLSNNSNDEDQEETCSCFIGYPNRGEIFDGDTRDWREPTKEEQETLGVKPHQSLGEWFSNSKIPQDKKKNIKLILGGCCRTTPENDIGSLAKMVC